MFFTFRRFWGHFTDHTAQKLSRSYRKSTKKWCRLTLFLQPFWAHLGPNMGPFGPKLAHLVPPLRSIVIQVKKVIRNVEISCFSKKCQKRSRKPLFTIFSVIFFRGRLLRFHHLLLQFLTDLDNSGCILFTIGWTSFCAIRILNFYLKTKWRPFHFDICCKKHFFSVCKLSGGAILV